MPITASSRFALPALILVLGALSATATAASAPATTAGLDRILVIVNDDVITASQLAARTEEARKQLAADKIKAPPQDVLLKQMTERLILERIQLQAAERAGLRATDADIDRSFAAVAKQNNLSPEQFRERIRKDGLDLDSFRQLLRQQFLIDQLLEREVRNRVHVSEGEIDAFLNNRESVAAVNTEYRLSHIFLPVPESASPEAIQAVKQKGEALLATLRGGASFEQAAIAQSQGADALKGGLLGWRKAGQLPELFVTALKGMPKGGLSELLRSPNGFHILKLHDKRGDLNVEPVQQTRVRHILVRPSEILSRDDARTKLLQLRARIEHGEDFATLARANSEDTGSATRGGDLGWTQPGQLVPEFEKAMNALKPGELGQPVQSAFGFHLIQVLERRTQDITEERLRNQARGQIHARKAEERYQQWLRQMRDEAYVEYLTATEE
jgi:peptidyl-prolyl cis-trans isomerase SurA